MVPAESMEITAMGTMDSFLSLKITPLGSTREVRARDGARIGDHWPSGAGEFFPRGGHRAAAVPGLRTRRTEGVCLVLEDLLVHAHYGTFLSAGLIAALPK
jgi:hypothetical protein